MDKIREKYRSLGNLGGTIQLTHLTIEEQEALSGYLRKDCFKKSMQIKVELFVKALDDTKYKEINFIHLLNAYFKEDLVSKKDELSNYEREKEAFFSKVVNQYADTLAFRWLVRLKDFKDNAYRMIIQKYDENKTAIETILCNVCDAINLLSFDHNNLNRLAILSSMVTKNPHYFDEDTFPNKLLIYAITFYLNGQYPENAEQTNEMMYQVGLIKDEVSNFTLCKGLLFYDEFGIHSGYKGFFDQNEPLQVTLLNLSKIKRIVSPTNLIFVFENATVFTEVYERTKIINPPLMCTFGNIKLASLIVLDKLVENGTTIYYSGDLDPEGLLIADKIKLRYKNHIKFFGFDSDHYLNHLSKQEMNQKRLNKLNKIQSEELKELIPFIKEHKVATYQELLIEYYVEKIQITFNQGDFYKLEKRV